MNLKEILEALVDEVYVKGSDHTEVIVDMGYYEITINIQGRMKGDDI